MTSGAPVFVFGASGHAKVVIDAIERAGLSRVLCVYDDATDKHGGSVLGYAIAGGRETLIARRNECCVGIVGIGDNRARAEVAAWLLANECALITVVHPAASIGREVEIGEGTVVMAGCVINSGTRIGANAIINTSASIDHDCSIGAGAHIAPGVRICGHVTVGAGAFVGAGSTIIPGVTIGERAVIGAGSTVLADLPEGARAAGSPCRLL